MLNKLKNDLKEKGLSIVAVAVQYENPDAVREFVDEYDVNFYLLLDTVVRPDLGITVADVYEVLIVPVSFVIDREGWIDGRPLLSSRGIVHHIGKTKILDLNSLGKRSSHLS